MFNIEFDYFIDNQDELVKKHQNKVLAIKGNEVIGVYENELDAYLDIEKNNQLGRVMIQPCFAGAAAYSMNITTLGAIST